MSHGGADSGQCPEHNAQRPACGVRSRLRFLCLTLALCAWPSPPTAHAQPATPASGERPTLYADFGFGGKLPANRWAPITVWISPGDRALGGVIVTEFDQDSTQSARIVTPFAAAPNAQTPVQVVAAIPPNTGRVVFTLYDERGRRIERLEYSDVPGSNAALMPPTVDRQEGLLVAVGRTSLPEAVRSWTDVTRAGSVSEWRSQVTAGTFTGPITGSDLERAWRRADCGAIQPGAMPLSWVAYDGVVVLVVEADAAMQAEPRAVEAVRSWVEGGGRLLIVADAPGPAWRTWLPDGVTGDVVTLGEIVGAPLPEECARAMRLEGDRDADVLPGEGETAEPLPPMPAPAGRVTIRPMTLAPEGARCGWQTRWDTPAGAALAEGPVGLGWVTVITLEPRTVGSVVSSRASGAVWRSALVGGASVWLESSVRDARVMYAMGGWGESESATVGILSRLSGLPVLGDAIFLAIAGCMLGLAVLVGPVDALVLKRLRARQRSWLTALAWIGVASAGAYAAPVLMRSGPSQVTRLTGIDRLVTASDRAPDPTAWQTGLTGIFSAQAGQATFQDPNQSAWWRGVSAVFDYMPSQRRISGVVATTQDAAGGTLGATRGNPLERVSMGLWTFRTFMDWTRIETALTARVNRDGDDWAVTVSEVPEGAVIANGCLRVGDRWITLDSDGRGAADRPDARAWRVPAADRWTDKAPRPWQRAGMREWYAQDERFTRPGMAASLPGTHERSRSIDQRVATGRWAVVYLHADLWPSDVTIDWVSRASRTTVIRLIVPLDEADRVPATAPTVTPRFDEGPPTDGPLLWPGVAPADPQPDPAPATQEPAPGTPEEPVIPPPISDDPPFPTAAGGPGAIPLKARA